MCIQTIDVSTHSYTVACLVAYIHTNIHGDLFMTDTDSQTLMLVCLHTFIYTVELVIGGHPSIQCKLAMDDRVTT